eukprot:TRINITY_DN4563_c0_g2_i4.p1 TRINITY_DN4563_c0_g2~~TRINITY_DN4563_c0_g2_i4.p1  ORF type:complete len:1290 (+),score=337.12 TRINITY_DN4563_c0_g2_i4:78-3947(+)
MCIRDRYQRRVRAVFCVLMSRDASWFCCCTTDEDMESALDAESQGTSQLLYRSVTNTSFQNQKCNVRVYSNEATTGMIQFEVGEDPSKAKILVKQLEGGEEVEPVVLALQDVFRVELDALRPWILRLDTEQTSVVLEAPNEDVASVWRDSIAEYHNVLLWKHWAQRGSGVIHLPTLCAMDMTVIKATGLAAEDVTGESDPFVQVFVRSHDLAPRLVAQTSVIENNCDPEWNQKFESIPLSLDDTLEFLVWDQDTGSSDDLLGAVQVPMRSLGGLRIWMTELTLFDPTTGADRVDNAGNKSLLQVEFRCRWHTVGPVRETWRYVREHFSQNFHSSWCSWCFEQRVHCLVKKKVFRRDIWQCTGCKNETLKCRRCKIGMTKSGFWWDDEWCAVCGGDIKQWGEHPAPKTTTARCSWCFKESGMTSLAQRGLDERVWECQSCQKLLIPCTQCNTTFARCSMDAERLSLLPEPFYADAQCLQCHKLVQDWNAPDNSGLLQRLWQRSQALGENDEGVQLLTLDQLKVITAATPKLPVQRLHKMRLGREPTPITVASELEQPKKGAMVALNPGGLSLDAWVSLPDKASWVKVAWVADERSALLHATTELITLTLTSNDLPEPLTLTIELQDPSGWTHIFATISQENSSLHADSQSTELQGGISTLADKSEFKLTQDPTAVLGDVTAFNCSLTPTQLRIQTQQFLCRLSELAFPTCKLDSFAPIRSSVKGRFLVDGHHAFGAMHDAIVGAKSTIFCAFWKHVPFMYLRRDPIDPDSRFDRLVQKKAEEGVKVYLLLFRPFTRVAMNQGSLECKEYLEALHPNIKVVPHSPPFEDLEWSHHQKFVCVDSQVAIMGGLDVTLGRWDNCQHKLVDKERKLFNGLDYYVTELGGAPAWGEDEHGVKAYQADEEQKFDWFGSRDEYYRLPWHDIDIEVHGAPAWDTALNFIQRWNHHTADDDEIEPLVPCELIETPADQQGTLQVQIARSVCEWSGGDRHEASLYAAWIDLIQRAQHYIYIEQQFFVSIQTGGGVLNQVGEALLKRIEYAIQQGRTFRVIVIFPFPEETGAGARALMQWQYGTISRGGHSILEQLNSKFPDVNINKYITFNALRRHDVMDGKPVSEQIFVHSKFLLVDDCYAQISSANLNDRSFLGNRDSEIGVTVLDDTEKVEITMNGHPFQANKFVHELRMTLWREHLGLEDDDTSITDPTCHQVFQDIWRKTACQNTRIFDTVFPNSIQDVMKTAERFNLAANVAFGPARLGLIKGHLVRHPVNFLKHEELDPKWYEKESILSRKVFQ